MKGDLLREATRALRETEESSELEARATRARVMSGLHQARVRRRTRYAFLLPIAATFVAASAWGAASGKVQLVWASIERIAHRSTPAQSRATASVRQSAGSVAQIPHPPAPEPLALQPLPALEVPATPPPRPTPVAEALPRKAEAAAPAAPIGSATATDPSLTLYRVAHTAHFVDHDPARALVAWDAYLAAAPQGTFAPEAHYNRALSLVRLGRNAEARGALEPFANGSYGGYRKAEAAALLERMGP